MFYIYKEYHGVKSKVTLNSNSIECFDCNISVRQGENLSPILFSLYTNDLE